MLSYYIQGGGFQGSREEKVKVDPLGAGRNVLPVRSKARAGLVGQPDYEPRELSDTRAVATSGLAKQEEHVDDHEVSKCAKSERGLPGEQLPCSQRDLVEAPQGC